jgi:hypothetical protein
MKPMLRAFYGEVLYRKHNLNASAIASLQGTSMQIDKDVSARIAEMEKSINDANAFVANMERT